MRDDGMLIRRPWTRAERRVVLHGVAGRICIAVEPLLASMTFLALTIGMFIVRTDPQHPADHNMIVLAPVFAIGALAFSAYAVVVMVAPLRALAQTFLPIYIVDGYVRYRGPDAHSPDASNGYVAVLDEERRTACEWPMHAEAPVPEIVRAARCEFSEYGGIHRIDAQLTGVLPEKIATFGVAISPRL